MKKLLIAIALFSVSLQASANTCLSCGPLEKIAKENFRSNQTLVKSRQMLVDFKFSTDKKIKSLEIQSYLKLALKAIQADGIGISDEYFYNAYAENKEDFDREIKKMKGIDMEIIKKSLKNVDGLRNMDDSK